MSLKVHTRTSQVIIILDLSGRITLGEGSVTVRDAVRKEIDQDVDQIPFESRRYYLH